MQKVCENCGAIYAEKDGYCKNCWKKVTDDIDEIKGLPKNDWEKFIGNKSDRYTKVFEKHEGKKMFFELNIAALLFGFNWMLYRKMYKYAFIHLLITVLFTFVVYGAVYGIYKNDVVLYQKLDVQYDSYVNEHWFDEEEQEDPAYFKDYYAVKERLEFLPAFLIGFLPFAMEIFLSLLGDCTYRAHVHQKLSENRKDCGGTSVGLFFAGGAINLILNITLITPVLEKFTNFFVF